MGEFYLPVLDSSFSILKATLESKNYTISDVSATIRVNIPLATIQSIFQYDSTNTLSNISDVDALDLRYYVFSANFPTSNSGTVISDVNIVENSSLNMKGDYISHLAKQLFNTERGVDLFNNENALLTDFQSKCNTYWTGLINNYIVPINTSNATNGTDTTSRKYLTNATSSTSNLTRELLLQMIYESSGSRFNKSLTTQLDGGTNLFKLPFIVGDKISFKLTVRSDPFQTSVIGQNPGTPVVDRVYKISLNVT